jgi:hypothetical protein
VGGLARDLIDAFSYGRAYGVTTSQLPPGKRLVNPFPHEAAGALASGMEQPVLGVRRTPSRSAHAASGAQGRAAGMRWSAPAGEQVELGDLLRPRQQCVEARVRPALPGTDPGVGVRGMAQVRIVFSHS